MGRDYQKVSVAWKYWKLHVLGEERDVFESLDWRVGDAYPHLESLLDARPFMNPKP